MDVGYGCLDRWTIESYKIGFIARGQITMIELREVETGHKKSELEYRHMEVSQNMCSLEWYLTGKWSEWKRCPFLPHGYADLIDSGGLPESEAPTHGGNE